MARTAQAAPRTTIKSDCKGVPPNLIRGIVDFKQLIEPQKCFEYRPAYRFPPHPNKTFLLFLLLLLRRRRRRRRSARGVAPQNKNIFKIVTFYKFMVQCKSVTV
jgi:hypothetical protein